MVNRWRAFGAILLSLVGAVTTARADSLTVNLSLNYSGTFGSATFTPATLTITDLATPLIAGEYSEQFELKTNNTLLVQAVGFNFIPSLASTLTFTGSTSIGLKSGGSVSNSENQDPDGALYGLFNVALNASGKTPSSDATWTMTSTLPLAPQDFLFPSKPPTGKKPVLFVAEITGTTGNFPGSGYWAAIPTPEPTNLLSLICISISCAIAYGGSKMIKALSVSEFV